MSCARVLTNAGLQDLQICQSEGCFIFQCLVLVNCILAPTTVSATLRFFLQKLLLALSNFTLVQEPALWGTHPSESKVHTLAFATRFLSKRLRMPKTVTQLQTDCQVQSRFLFQGELCFNHGMEAEQKMTMIVPYS